MSPHPAPASDATRPLRWRLITASVRLPANEPLAEFKTCNKLPQILARSQADSAGADDALLLNTEGGVVEGSSSNLFWIEGGKVRTPSLAAGILAGVTREVVMELSRGLGIEAGEGAVMPKGLLEAEGVFLSLSSIGLAEAVSLDGCKLSQSPVVQELFKEYHRLVARESGGI